MADIKLSYFDARGRAELSRLILAYAGVPLSHPPQKDLFWLSRTAQWVTLFTKSFIIHGWFET